VWSLRKGPPVQAPGWRHRRFPGTREPRRRVGETSLTRITQRRPAVPRSSRCMRISWVQSCQMACWKWRPRRALREPSKFSGGPCPFGEPLNESVHRGGIAPEIPGWPNSPTPPTPRPAQAASGGAVSGFALQDAESTRPTAEAILTTFTTHLSPHGTQRDRLPEARQETPGPLPRSGRGSVPEEVAGVVNPED
jgi:hypothetical protein